MASKTKIYIVLELVTGGELFDKIVRNLCLLLECKSASGIKSQLCINVLLLYINLVFIVLLSSSARQAKGG